MFVTSDLSYMNGTAVHVEALSEELAKRGHNVHIFGSKNTKYTFPYFKQIGHATNFQMPGGGRGPIITALPDVDATALIKKGNYDICHIHDPFIPFIAWELANIQSIKKVTTFHTCWNDTSFYTNLQFVFPFLSDFYRERFDGTIYVSKLAERCWKPLAGKSEQQGVIGNGVGVEFIPAERKKKKIIQLLFIGRIEPRKGIMFLLEAVRILIKKYPDIRLNVLGKGTQLAEAKEFVEINNLTSVVKFRGEIIGEEKIKYLQQADIFCAPYKNEAFGLTVLEAISCGCTVVGFWEEGFKAFLNQYPHLNKLFPKKKTAKDLAAALKYVLDNPQVRDETAKAGLPVSNQFRWSRIAEEVESFYYSL